MATEEREFKAKKGDKTYVLKCIADNLKGNLYLIRELPKKWYSKITKSQYENAKQYAVSE